jgi:DNA-binding Xre family transcriptional regulator
MSREFDGHNQEIAAKTLRKTQVYFEVKNPHSKLLKCAKITREMVGDYKPKNFETRARQAMSETLEATPKNWLRTGRKRKWRGKQGRRCENLLLLTGDRNATLTELAKRAKMHRQSLSDTFSGKQSIKLEQLARLANGLNCTLDYLGHALLRGRESYIRRQREKQKS